MHLRHGYWESGTNRGLEPLCRRLERCLRAALGATLELRDVSGNLLGDQGLLHAVQNGLGFRERQAQFLRPQRTGR